MGLWTRCRVHFLEDEKGSRPRFFYQQYRLTAEPIDYGAPDNFSLNRQSGIRQTPDWQPDELTNPEVSDPIDLLVSRLKGKTLLVHSPTEFAKAVEAIRRP